MIDKRCFARQVYRQLLRLIIPFWLVLPGISLIIWRDSPRFFGERMLLHEVVWIAFSFLAALWGAVSECRRSGSTRA